MKIIVNLSNLKMKEDVLYKFGEVFEFGGPSGNIAASSFIQGKGWGFNWNAMSDSLRYLEEGGIWGTSKKFIFPLEIEISDYKEFKENDPENFEILEEILNGQLKEYREKGKVIKVIFS